MIDTTRISGVTTGEAFGAVLVGMKPMTVRVSASFSPGCEDLTLTGLSETATRETRARIRAAFGRVTVDVPGLMPMAEGAYHVTVHEAVESAQSLELAIVVAMARAHGRTVFEADHVFVGELALDGRVRPVRGAGVYASAFPKLVASAESEHELLALATVPAGLRLVRTIADLYTGDEVQSLVRESGKTLLTVAEPKPLDLAPSHAHLFSICEKLIETGHHVLLVGRAGSGKTMIARRLATCTPALTTAQAKEVLAVQSVAGLLSNVFAPVARPFRAPHHTVSDLALTGDQRGRRPGEVSLAHHGVLFLDELPEFRRSSLEALSFHLREARDGHATHFPSKPWGLVAAANPCACGNRTCVCGPETRSVYARRLASVARLFNFTRVDVPDVTLEELMQPASVPAEVQPEGVAERAPRASDRSGDEPGRDS